MMPNTHIYYGLTVQTSNTADASLHRERIGTFPNQMRVCSRRTAGQVPPRQSPRAVKVGNRDEQQG